MTRSALTLGIAVTLALAVAGEVAAAPQAEPAKPSNVEKSVNETAFLSGKVVETMDGGGYTYVLLEKNGVKTWVAAPRMNVVVGQEIAFQPGIEMVNFPSKALNRTFERIIFSGGPIVKEDAGNEAAMKSAHGGKSLEELQGKPAGALPKAPADDNVKVDKATGPNAYTVAELYEKRGALDKQKVVVRGKVVKVSSGIMGKNWVHLRDGSGTAQTKLVVTTQDEPSVGDVVTATGTLYKDKDFGSGYRYELIMEEASVKK